MKLLISNIYLELGGSEGQLRQQVAKKLKVRSEFVKELKIVKQSIDARRKPGIRLVCTVSCSVDNYRLLQDNDVRELEEAVEEILVPGNKKMTGRPIIVGTGPAGIFCALLLARKGYKPLVIERGSSVPERSKAVEKFWKGGQLDPETNVQFGEGGAGTFSDGKLTTRINDRRCEQVLRDFHKFGAHDEILYKAKPHIGTDILKNVIVNMRKEIEQLGGTVMFNTRMDDILSRDGRVHGIVTANNGDLLSDVVVLALGHSARDTFKVLHDKGITFEQKPFSIGVRIEHPQSMIDRAQYGDAAGHPILGAADYQLFNKVNGRTAYSFCMCPGGVVVASASEPESIVTNGMSEFKRDKENANSALVVSVGPGDFESSHPLAGIEFQRKWERLAYQVAGANDSAPVQALGDFVEGRVGKIGSVKPSYTGNVTCSDINKCLPQYVTDCMKQSIAAFDRKIHGFGLKDAMLTGVETRTSSPVRIPRNNNLECVNMSGLYPAGEGAGYAGGIVSAAVDGLRIAEQIIRTYCQPE
jgi:uncharacterized FAD-dependent dehydrogenase